MIRRLVALLLVFGMVAPAWAGPRKVLVLPLDGTAPPDTRKKLSASFQKMARVLEGDVQPGSATMGDAALAVGCDPAKTSCVENVRATLGVDELVYGTANEENGTITIIAKRYKKGKDPREVTVSQAASDPPSKIEPELLPVFSNDPLPANNTTNVTDPNNGNTNTNVTNVTDPNNGNTNTNVTDPNNGQKDTPIGGGRGNRDRNIAIGITAGGGVIVLLGLALWSQAGSLQDEIDDKQVNDADDLEELKDLEDKASSRGWAGNICVLAGLAVAGYGVYRLMKWRNRPADVTVTPTPVEGGAAVFVGGRW